MTCHQITSGKKVVGFVCVTPSYYTFVGSRKVQFTYHPYLGFEIIDNNGRTRKKGVTKKEWGALFDWMHRNTYRRALKPYGREIIGYVKPRWKP